MALDDNSRRLKAILDGFDIPVSTVADICGLSRTYVSRVLSPNDPLTGNDPFWLKIEKSMGKLIDARRGQVFQISAMPVEKIEQVEELRKAS